MKRQGRPAEMSDIEWLVALEEIKQLKARRDRYVDAHDWDGYESLHAPDHVSHHAVMMDGTAPEPWRSASEMVKNVRTIMDEHSITMHHSYDPEIIFDTRTKARAIWAMTAADVSRDDEGKPTWFIIYGHYHESYEKRDGVWLFTTRRWHRYLGTGSDGVIFPTQPIKGSDAFAMENWPYSPDPD